MAAFLASFNLGPDAQDSVDEKQCDSADALQQRLRSTLDEKVTPTRADHVAIALDLADSAQLTMSLSPADNAELQGLEAPPAATGEEQEQQTTRLICMRDTLQDNSAGPTGLQNVVARYIISTIAEVDQCRWVAGDVSRCNRGWTISYVCKKSMEQWQREKAGTKVPIMEYGKKPMDPRQAGEDPSCPQTPASTDAGPEQARPAFDCRGCIQISFNRGNDSVSIQYDHMLLHKSVGELAQLFKPPLPPWPDKPAKPVKTPKSAGTPRKKRESTKAEGISGQSTKRKKGRGGTVVAEAPGNRALSPESIALAAIQAANQDYSSYSQGEAAVASEQAINDNQEQDTGFSPVNVTPEEAGRRREVASAMLRDIGLDPSSLSSVQFNVFANQSPEMQRESLSMLVEYGAGRLQVVQPASSDQNATDASPSTQPSRTGPITTRELVPEGLNGDASKVSDPAANDDIQLEAAGSKPSRKKSGRMGKSRSACIQCKSRKVKCPKDKPVCLECQENGHTCEYPPKKPRGSKAAAEKTAIADGSVVEASDMAQMQHETQDEPEEAEELEQPLPPPDEQHYQQYAQIMQTQVWPVEDDSSAYPPPPSPSSQSQPQYFQSASGLVLPQAEMPATQSPWHDHHRSASRHTTAQRSQQQEPPTRECSLPRNHSPLTYPPSSGHGSPVQQRSQANMAWNLKRQQELQQQQMQQQMAQQKQQQRPNEPSSQTTSYVGRPESYAGQYGGVSEDAAMDQIAYVPYSQQQQQHMSVAQDQLSLYQDGKGGRGAPSGRVTSSQYGAHLHGSGRGHMEGLPMGYDHHGYGGGHGWPGQDARAHGFGSRGGTPGHGWS